MHLIRHMQIVHRSLLPSAALGQPVLAQDGTMPATAACSTSFLRHLGRSRLFFACLLQWKGYYITYLFCFSMVSGWQRSHVMVSLAVCINSWVLSRWDQLAVRMCSCNLRLWDGSQRRHRRTTQTRPVEKKSVDCDLIKCTLYRVSW